MKKRMTVVFTVEPGSGTHEVLGRIHSCQGVEVNSISWGDMLAQLTRFRTMLDSALDDDWENPDLVSYRTMRNRWSPR